MKAELNERGRGWGKGLAACILFLGIAVLFLALDIYHSETVAIVAGAIGTALFDALEAVQKHFPDIIIEEAHEPQEWK